MNRLGSSLKNDELRIDLANAPLGTGKGTDEGWCRQPMCSMCAMCLTGSLQLSLCLAGWRPNCLKRKIIGHRQDSELLNSGVTIGWGSGQNLELLFLLSCIGQLGRTMVWVPRSNFESSILVNPSYHQISWPERPQYPCYTTCSQLQSSIIR